MLFCKGCVVHAGKRGRMQARISCKAEADRCKNHHTTWQQGAHSLEARSCDGCAARRGPRQTVNTHNEQAFNASSPTAPMVDKSWCGRMYAWLKNRSREDRSSYISRQLSQEERLILEKYILQMRSVIVPYKVSSSYWHDSEGVDNVDHRNSSALVCRQPSEEDIAVQVESERKPRCISLRAKTGKYKALMHFGPCEVRSREASFEEAIDCHIVLTELKATWSQMPAPATAEQLHNAAQGIFA
jgi:hypothetical protein